MSKQKKITKIQYETTKKKYIFKLKNINPEAIDKKFGIQIVSNITTTCNKIPPNTTKISDLSINKNTEVISFLDEAKKAHRCNISMIDFQTNTEINSSLFQYNCFWCRHEIPENIIGIGCPIKYLPSQAVKSYYSEISKDNYVIKEDITTKRGEKIHESKDSRLNIVNKNYYLTDGIFCSFNCCIAYIIDNKHNSMYDMSEMLLLKMYNDVWNSSIIHIDSAPHWRKLNRYGGDMSIEKFRSSFNKIEYKEHGIIFDMIKFKSVGVLFEEKLKF